MPYLRGDPEMFDEILSEVDAEDLPPDFASKRPSGEYEYERAEAVFESAKLGAEARQALDALRAAGATALRVNYDGGHDEGFAHPQAVMFGAEQRSVEQAAKDLAASQSAPGMSQAHSALGAIEWLAHELASVLLGDGYGTGEYTMYGAFTADFATGRIVDDPKATKPTNLDLE